MQELRIDLERARGFWLRMSRDTGVNHSTIVRIVHGRTPHPQIHTYGKIRGWLDSHPDFLAARSPEQAV